MFRETLLEIFWTNLCKAKYTELAAKDISILLAFLIYLYE